MMSNTAELVGIQLQHTLSRLMRWSDFVLSFNEVH